MGFVIISSLCLTIPPVDPRIRPFTQIHPAHFKPLFGIKDDSLGATSLRGSSVMASTDSVVTGRRASGNVHA
ncbi:hypothetical protein J6590_005788 [Homalodisca vitripennis]|nr:hypothetical protein J6590_005788 [Homalodisca vitripennis]